MVGESEVNGKKEKWIIGLFGCHFSSWLLSYMSFCPEKTQKHFFFLIMLMSFIFEIHSQDAKRQSCGWVCSA